MQEARLLRPGGALGLGDLREVAQVLRSAGLAVIPSDTGYAVAASVNCPTAVATLRTVLSMPDASLSVACADLEMLEEYASLGLSLLRVADNLLPGALTLVAPLAKGRTNLASVLGTDGTVGARIPDATVERDVAQMLGNPITTTAIRDNGEIVRDCEQACDIVRHGLDALEIQSLVATVKSRGFAYDAHSTVVKVFDAEGGGARVQLLREGATPMSDVLSASRRMSSLELVGWT
jgi:tRNA threonylcarbamoyl adenosine modification protein (Sua5/YciO/YrdC/YwlC family)